MCDFVLSTGLSRVALGQEEVLQIVNTLVYDGKASPPALGASVLLTNFAPSCHTRR